MVYFGDLPTYLENWGFYDFVFPFLLFFAILYGLLEKTKIFGDSAKAVNIIVSATMSFFIVKITPLGYSLAEFLTQQSGLMAMFLYGALMFLIIGGLVGYKFDEDDHIKKIMPGVMIGVVLIALVLFAYFNYFRNTIYIDSEWVSISLFILIIGAIGLWLYKEN